MKIIGLKTVFAGLLVAATATSALCAAGHGCGRDVPGAALRQVGRCLQQGDRRSRQLPVGRFGRGPAPDPRQDGRLRRVRHAADRRGTGQGRPDPVPDGDRRRGSGDQRRRHPDAPAAPDGAGPGRHLPRQDHQVERSGDRGAEPGREAAGRADRGGAPGRRFGHDVHLHQLPVEGERGVEVEGRRGHRGQLADGRGRQGQRGRGRVRAAPAELDRLRRVRLREAEQARVRADAELRGCLRCAGRRRVQGGGRRR